MIVLLAILCLSGHVFAASPCDKKRFDQDSFASVCNEQLRDTYEPIKQSNKGIVQVYTSTRNGKRFEKTQEKFGNNNPLQGQEWKIKIDKNKKYQNIMGFGTSFSDAGVLNLGSLSSNLQKQILSDMFAQDGFEYSVVRTTIAGSDFSQRAYSYDDVDDDYDLKHFSLVDEDLKLRIPQIKMTNSLSKHKVKFFGSPWSGPAWLKTNHKLNGAGTLKEGPGSRTWKTYAKYLLKWLQSYRQNGVEYWGMTVQNEPKTGFAKDFPWNTMGYTPEMERDFIKTDLGPTLEQAGWTPKNFSIMFYDHDRDTIASWADVVLKDKDAAKYVKGVAVHWYGDMNTGPSHLTQTHNAHPDFFILATEACVANWSRPESRVALGNWEFGEAYAVDIMRDLSNWAVGWVDWNMVLDPDGMPNWTGKDHTQSAPIIVEKNKHEYYKNPTLYAIGHYSKVIPPGSNRIGMSPEKIEDNGFYANVFQRPDGGVVVIVINKRNEQQAFIVEDPEIGSQQLKMQIEPHSFNSWVYYH